MASGLLETTPHIGEPTDRTLDFMAGGGQMGALMRARDWSSSALGPVETWPQSLRTTISTCLECAFPILVWWGPKLVMLYNDEYRMILGSEKHPMALGAAGRAVFPELWDLIGPMLDQVLREGRATRSRDLMLVMNRYGYDEETYFSFSYSPIRDESGGIGGVFTPVVETTERVIGERRLRTLRDLAARPRPAGLAQAAAAAADVLAENLHDIPFATIYQLDDMAADATLIGTAGIDADAAAAPSVRLISADSEACAFDRVARGGSYGLVEDIGGRFGDLPCGAWPEAPKTAIILPITPPGRERPIAVLVAAVSPRRALDAEYRAFFDLIADQLSKTMAEVVAYQEERRRAEALAEIDRAKTQFFANVSHEFRTPLTLMLGPLEALAEAGDLTDPQHEQVALAHRNSLRLLKLVNALLDFSRIEAGRSQAAFEPVDMAALTADLAANFRSATDRAGLALRVEAPPLPAPVYLDRDMWEKIVLNLISNAFKFTFEGEISVRVTAAPDGRMALLTVRDTGVGIPTRELPHLFKRFHRVEGARGRSIEGSGIGLALVRELARLHGGEVSVVSAPGQGAAFTVSIPFGKDHLDPGQIAPRAPAPAAQGVRGFVEEALRWLPDADAEAHGADRPPPPGAFAAGGVARRVLVVDDNADMRDYVRRLLEGEGYRVSAASDGLEALAAAVSDPPDLVLSDVMMPGLDGFGLIQGLRARPATRTAPVILLSARAGEAARIEGLKAGAEDYLVKPFSARELVARVEAAIKLTETRQAAAQALRDENMRMRSLFEQAPGFVCILAGPSHVIEFANAAAETIFGKRDLVGKSVLAAVPEVERQGFIALLDAVYATGQRFVGQEVPLRLDQPDGGEADALYLDFIYEPIIDAAGQVTGIFVEGHDVTDRRQYEQHLHLLIEELNHRVKNTLAIVQGVSRQTFRTPGDPEERRQAFDGRLSALAAAHGLLTRANWEAADLKAIALTVLEAQSDGAERYRVEGPRVKLEPKTAVTLAMAFHELCTNATKYGALSVETGAIELTWRVEPGPEPRLRLSWRENGGPQVSAPSRRGFGARMIEHALASELNGLVRLDFLPTGLECHIDAPLPMAAGAMFKLGDRP